jgi:hypothetical protein
MKRNLTLATINLNVGLLSEQEDSAAMAAALAAYEQTEPTAATGLVEAGTELENVTQAVEDGGEAAQVVDAALAPLEESQEEINTPALEALRICLKHMSGQLGIPTSRRMGMESDATLTNRQIAMEGIKEFASKIWEAIKAAFAKISEWIKGFFTWLFRMGDRTEKALAVEEKRAESLSKVDISEKAAEMAKQHKEELHALSGQSSAGSHPYLYVPNGGESVEGGNFVKAVENTFSYVSKSIEAKFLSKTSCNNLAALLLQDMKHFADEKIEALKFTQEVAEKYYFMAEEKVDGQKYRSAQPLLGDYQVLEQRPDSPTARYHIGFERAGGATDQIIKTLTPAESKQLAKMAGKFIDRSSLSDVEKFVTSKIEELSKELNTASLAATKSSLKAAAGGGSFGDSPTRDVFNNIKRGFDLFQVIFCGFLPKVLSYKVTLCENIKHHVKVSNDFAESVSKFNQQMENGEAFVL